MPNNKPSSPQWLEWAREIQSLAQIGFTYAENDFQRERNQRLTELAAEIVAEHSNLTATGINSNFRVQPGYATPKVDVRGAVFRDGKILMVREKLDDGWTMPGGWADVSDFPAESAEREVWEESGFKVKATKLIGVYDANRVVPMEFYHAYKLVFLCEIIGGEATTSIETTDVQFYAVDEIPQNFAGERTRQRHVDDAFAAFRNPEIPTVFD
jgi:ADP-ribose pyrophosphatase YjhB (NUDIX family)